MKSDNRFTSIRTIALAALWLALSGQGLAAGDAELIAAVQDVARNGARAKPAARALILSRNKDFQRLALDSRQISPADFEACQGWYVDTVTRYAEEAGKNLRPPIKVTPQTALKKPKKPGQVYIDYNPGTDLDLITGATTPEEIKKLQDALNTRITEEVEKNLPGSAGKANWLHANDIDMMADPAKTSAENFKAISKMNNFAYESRGAARFEAWNRLVAEAERKGLPPPPVVFNDLADYLNEMKNASSRRSEEIAGLKEALRNPEAGLTEAQALERAKLLEKDLYIAQAQQAKLVDRINDATDAMLKQYPVPEGSVVRGSTAASRGKVRSMDLNPYSPGLANELNDFALQEAYMRNAEALSAIAKENPQMASCCADQIRKTCLNLSPKNRAEVLERIKVLHGEEAAESMKAAIFGTLPEGFNGLGGKYSAPYAIGSSARTAEEAAEELAAALAAGNNRKAMGAVEAMNDQMKKARSLASLAGASATTGLEGFADDFARIRNAASKLPLTEQAAFMDAALKKLFASGGYEGRMAAAVKRAAQDAALLKVMADEGNAMRKAIMRDMLQGGKGAAPSLWAEIRTLAGALPIEQLLIGTFAYLDVAATAQFMKEGKTDEAGRKALEALAMTLGNPVTGVAVVISNLIIDAAKDAGYSIATNQQDLDDLLAGIISVKGWESADGSGIETSIERLALDCTTEAEVKQVLKDVIERASLNSSDAAKVTAGKKQSLLDENLPKVVAKWREKRVEFAQDFLSTLPALDQLMDGVSVRVDCAPDPVPLLKRRAGDKRGTGNVRLSVDGPIADLQYLALDLAARLNKLGGKQHLLILSFRQRVAWTLDGQAQPEVRSYGLEPVILEKPLHFTEAGPHRIACQVTWEMVPVSAITEDADFRGRQWTMNPLKSSSYTKESGLSLTWQMIGREDTFKPGDVVAHYAKDMTRTYARLGEGVVVVVDNNEDDRIDVFISGKVQVMPDETAVLTPVYKCAEGVDAKAFIFKWSGPVRGAGDTAFFKQTKPGSYEVGLTVYRGGSGGPVKLATAAPVTIEVLRPDDAEFSLRVDGPRRASVGEDIRLRVKTFCGNPAAEHLLQDRNVWIEWHVNGQPIDTSDSLFTSATTPGAYAFEAKLVWHGEAGDRVLASASHAVEVGEAEAIRPVDDTKPTRPIGPDGGTTPSGVKPAPPDPAPKTTDREATTPGLTPVTPSTGSGTPGGGGAVMAGVPGGDVFYGSTVSLTFGPPPGPVFDRKALSDALQAISERPTKVPTPEDRARETKEIMDALAAMQNTPYIPGGGAQSDDNGRPLQSSDVSPDNNFAPGTQPIPLEHPDASWMGEPDDSPSPPPPPPDNTITPPVTAPSPAPLRYVFLSSPTLTFSPPESDKGATKVTFDRMGEVKIWAQIFTNASAPPFETPQALYRVKGSALSIACAPAGAKIGEEVRSQVTAAPAIPDGLVNYYWSAPASSDRMEYSGNSDKIGFMPKSGDPITLQVEARTPAYNETIGSASATYAPAAYSVNAQVVGRLGPKPMVWSASRGGLVPAPDNAYVVDEAIRLRATLTGEPRPDPIRWSWSVNAGTTLRSSGIGDEISVSRSEAGTAGATVTVKDKNNNVLGTATASFTVSPNEPPLPLSVKVGAGETKLRSGDRTGLQITITGGVPPYSVVWTGAKGAGVSAFYAAGQAGSQTITATVTDKGGKTATGSITLVVEAVPLEVTIQAEKRDLLPGETVALQASVTGGTAPYRFTWTGTARDTGEDAVFEAARLGPVTVSVDGVDSAGNTGHATCGFTVSPITIRVVVAGVSGEPASLWHETSHVLKPLAAGRYAAGQRMRVRASVVGTTLPAGAGFIWTPVSGCTLAGSANGPEVEVTLTGKGTAEIGVRLVLKEVTQGTAAVKIPVEVSAEDIAAAKKKEAAWNLVQDNERKAKSLLVQGYECEKKGELGKAVEIYRAAQSLANDPKVADHIAGLEKMSADRAQARRLVDEGYALEKQGKIPAAIAKYRSSLALVDNPGVRSHIAEVKAAAANPDEAPSAPPVVTPSTPAGRSQGQAPKTTPVTPAGSSPVKPSPSPVVTPTAKPTSTVPSVAPSPTNRAVVAQSARNKQGVTNAALNVTGVFKTRMEHDGQTLNATMTLQQKGVRITGHMTAVLAGVTKTQPISATLKGNKMVSDISDAKEDQMTISPDSNTLTLSVKEGQMVFKRVN